MRGGKEKALKKYIVKLTPEEREELLAITSKGKASARMLKRAMVLLASDDGDSDSTIAGKLRLHSDTVSDIRRRCAEGGVQAGLHDRRHPGKARLLDGRQEAHLIALTCSTPPEGRSRWTMQLLADKLVELQVVENISDETVRRTLKRGTKTLAVSGVVLPELRS
jgi:transposase